MDLAQTLAILNDPQMDIYWDECWDRVMESRDDSEGTVRLLLDALDGQTQIARLCAIRKLSQLAVNGNLWCNQLCRLLDDQDYAIRGEALAASRSFLASCPSLVAAVRRMQQRASEHLGLRIKAWWCLRSHKTEGTAGKRKHVNPKDG